MISPRVICFDLLAVQGTLKSLLHNSKAAILQHSGFFMIKLSHANMTTGKTIALTIQSLPCWLSAKEFACNARVTWFDSWVGKIPWRRKWQPTPVFLPGESQGQRSLVGCSPGGSQSQTRLNDFPFTFHFHALEKEMATHSSVLAWRIPGMGEPGGLPSMGSHRVGHD